MKNSKSDVRNKIEIRTLTEEEKKSLKHLSALINKGLRRNYSIGKALCQIKELLKGTSLKFSDYCQQNFFLASSQVNRLMEYARVRDIIGENEEKVLIPERVLRPMSQVPDQEMQTLWNKAKEQSKGKIPTSELVAELVKPYQQGKVQSQSFEMKFHSKALGHDVDLEKTGIFELIEKAESSEKIKILIHEIHLRKPLSKEEQDAALNRLTEVLTAEFQNIINVANVSEPPKEIESNVPTVNMDAA